jgi:diguanylate cyclase (GGDEF)-like protein
MLIFEKEEAAFRIVRELESGGYAMSHVRAETSEQALEALEQGSLDIVVADSRLWRSFDHAVRRRFRNAEPSLPVLILQRSDDMSNLARSDAGPRGETVPILERVKSALASVGPLANISPWRLHLPLAVTIVAGAALSLALFFLVRGNELSRLRSDFNILAADRSYSLRSGVAEDATELRYLSFYIESSNALRRGAFEDFAVEYRRFIGGIPSKETDTQIVAFVDRVQAAERTVYEQRIRKTGDADFAIKDMEQGGGLQPAANRAEYFPISIAEPSRASAVLAGLDLSTVPELREAIDHAVQTGKLTTTGRVDLPPLPAEGPVAWMFQPAFENGNIKGRLIGLAAYAFRIDQMVEFAMRELSPAGIDLQLSDPSAPTERRILYYHKSRAMPSGSPPASEHPVLVWSASLDAGEREWALVAYPTASFIARRSSVQSWAVLIVGTLVTTLAGVLVYGRLRRIGRIESLVAERTRDLSREVAKHRRLERALERSRATLTSRVSELDQRNREILLLNEVGDLLEACLSTAEALPVISQYAPKLLPDTSGALYLRDPFKGVFSETARWGGSPPAITVFRPQDCWALRRGHAHSVDGKSSALPCPHSSPREEGGSICVPLSALGETIGLFHVAGLHEEAHAFALSVAEHAGLALSNLKLRSDLQQLSIHDPLTGLYNRRYMEEALELELRRAERKKSTVGVIMLDIDHFKAFNDGFGHAAGDDLLRALGSLVHARLRAGDIACRFGGEEFVLILPEASLEATREKAEELRAHVKAMEVRSLDKRLGPVSISLGIAIVPDHGRVREEVLRVADAALYRAKGEGRDRVVVAEGSEEKRR